MQDAVDILQAKCDACTVQYCNQNNYIINKALGAREIVVF